MAAGERGCICTFLDPLIQAGFVILARNGIVLAVQVRETQLSGVLVNVRRDICGVWNWMMQLSHFAPSKPRVSDKTSGAQRI